MFAFLPWAKKNSRVYSPLRSSSDDKGEFRLLLLHPGRQGSEIHGELHQVPIRSPPAYEALSYTWGDPTGVRSRFRKTKWEPGQCRTINIGDHRFEVTYNLHAALQRIRSESVRKALWVDAVCIDQSSPDEKGEQVQLMAAIYRQAQRVLCWLGEADLYTDRAFDTLHELSWALKACIWQHCAKKLDIPISELSEAAAISVIESEVLSAHWAPSSEGGLFDILRSGRIRREFLEGLELIPMDCSSHASLADLAVFIFGHSRPLPQLILSGSLSSSEIFSAQDIYRALRETFWFRAYWERLWVVQEIHNAKEAVILCGNRWTDARVMPIMEVLFLSTLPTCTGDKYLISTASSRVFLNQIASELTRTINLYVRSTERIRNLERNSLTRNLFLEKTSITSEPHDAIYALLNVSEPNGIVPNYNISVPELFINTTRALIRQHNNFNIMCFTVNEEGTKSHGLNLRFQLPSWVPHYNTILEYQNFDVDNGDYSGYECPTNTETNLSVSDTRVLNLTGLFHSKITKVSKKFMQRLSDSEWVDIISIKQSESIDVKFWRVFFRDDFIIGPMHSPYRARMVYSDEALATLERELQAVWTTSHVTDRLRYALKHYSHEKSICVTSTNQPVLVFGDAKVGDQIFYAHGAPCPFVVRPTVADDSFLGARMEKGISTFNRLVGPSYMHGIMGGKLFDTSPSSAMEEESIYLI